MENKALVVDRQVRLHHDKWQKRQELRFVCHNFSPDGEKRRKRSREWEGSLSESEGEIGRRPRERVKKNGKRKGREGRVGRYSEREVKERTGERRNE